MSTRRFSPRLEQIIELVGGQGMSYVEVAAALELSVRTVEDYATEIRTLAGIAKPPRTALFMLYRDRLNGNGGNHETA